MTTGETFGIPLPEQYSLRPPNSPSPSYFVDVGVKLSAPSPFSRVESWTIVFRSSRTCRRRGLITLPRLVVLMLVLYVIVLLIRLWLWLKGFYFTVIRRFVIISFLMHPCVGYNEARAAPRPHHLLYQIRFDCKSLTDQIRSDQIEIYFGQCSNCSLISKVPRFGGR
jgi:hypothetical protein